MKVNWKKLRKNIPNKVRVSSRKYFNILWSDGLVDTVGNKLFGKTEFAPDQIVLTSEQTDKDAVLTAMHEAFHAWDHAHEINLTEAQVVKLEKLFPLIRELVLVLEGKKK